MANKAKAPYKTLTKWDVDNLVAPVGKQWVSVYTPKQLAHMTVDNINDLLSERRLRCQAYTRKEGKIIKLLTWQNKLNDANKLKRNYKD